MDKSLMMPIMAVSYLWLQYTYWQQERGEEMRRSRAWKAILWSSLAILLLGGIAGGTTVMISDEKADSIKNAISKAQDGDRIIIKSGTYRGNFNVTKRLIIRGVDTGGGMPVLDANDRQSAVTLYADGVRLEGLKITNSGGSAEDAGVKILSSGNWIRGNLLSNSSHGIYLQGSSGNVIEENTALRNDVGISLSNSSANRIIGNNASLNSFGGIFLGESKDNHLEGNRAVANSWVGILLSNSSNNTLLDNLAQGNFNQGAWLLRSHDNLLRSNVVANNPVFGLLLTESSNNTLIEGQYFGNLDGISLDLSANNTIQSNNISHNVFGIYLDRSAGNRIFQNEFLDNEDSVYAWASFNLWTSPGPLSYEYRGSIFWSYLGNFWSDYSPQESYGGVGGSPYLQRSAEDQRPLVSRRGEYVMMN
jgi:parallel beta-helix repeat protein